MQPLACSRAPQSMKATQSLQVQFFLQLYLSITMLTIVVGVFTACVLYKAG